MDKRVAIVTGASRGIGRAIAKRLAKDGRHVVAVARNAEQLKSLEAEIAADGGACEHRTCDLSDGAAVQRLVEEVAEKHGRLDILVNNAGITKDGLLMRMSDADFDEVVNVNLRSVFIACRAAARSSFSLKNRRLGRPVRASWMACSSASRRAVRSAATDLSTCRLRARLRAMARNRERSSRSKDWASRPTTSCSHPSSGDHWHCNTPEAS
jgi:NAD(P)-dependent dehydrogenase (short-subunit alcohol dehydrogenase family)